MFLPFVGKVLALMTDIILVIMRNVMCFSKIDGALKSLTNTMCHSEELVTRNLNQLEYNVILLSVEIPRYARDDIWRLFTVSSILMAP